MPAGEDSEASFLSVHTVVKDRSETPSFYFLAHDVFGGGGVVMHTWSECYLPDLGSEEPECSRARAHKEILYVWNRPNVAKL